MKESSKAAETAKTDEELMLLFQQGWRGAFDEILSRFKGPVVQFLYHYVRDGNLAHDLAQETFLAVFKARETYQPVGLLRTWVLSIARNQAFSHFRRMGRHPDQVGGGGDAQEALESIARETPVPSRKLEMQEEIERVRKAVDELPPIYREVVYLRIFKDYPYREIADVLGVNESTLRTRMEYALKYLRIQMKAE